MPLKLIKKLGSKLLRRRPDNPADGLGGAPTTPRDASAGASSSRRRPPRKPMPVAPARGLAASAGAGETWRPGKDCPKTQPSDEPPPPRAAARTPSRTASETQPSAPADAPPRRRRRGPRRRKPEAAEAAPAVGASESPAAPPVDAPARAPRAPRAPRVAAPVAESAPEPAAQPWSLDQFVVPPKEGATRFHDLELPDELMHAIADLGFEYCTPVQARVLPHARVGKNVTGRAQTGTGKTAAFLISVFAQCLVRPKPDRKPGTPRALVLAPTRELVAQIVSDAEGLTKYLPLKSLAVYGGMEYSKQERALRDGTIDLIAATPGRLLDFKQRGVIDLSEVEWLIIDEADRMLDMGFIPDVRRIIRATPPKERRQSMLFSATLTDDVMRLATQWMPDPEVVEIERDQVAVDTVTQLVYIVSSREKLTVLYNLVKHVDHRKLLIFANRRDRTERIADALTRLGVHCELLSGAVNQSKRMRVLEDFKAGRVNVLVATDVAGRGLHVDDIDCVVNFDLPYEPDDYVHRIGRTGRAGALGKAVSFACEDESFIIPDIEKYIGETMVCRMPEEELMKPLPPMARAAPVLEESERAREHGGGSGSRGGRRGSGGSRSSGGGPRGGSSRARR